MEILFWTCIALLFYTFIGYGALLWFINLFIRPKKLPNLEEAQLPYVTVLIPAWNEEQDIVEKIENTIHLYYPSHKKQIIVITDGSTDQTPELASRFEAVTLLHRPERAGKVGALNRAKQFVKGDICVITDANTMLNTQVLRKMVRHFQDPLIGAVAGEKRVLTPESHLDASKSEGLYWRYESTLKQWDANLYSVTGAAGELMAVRSKLFMDIPPDTIIEDYYLSMLINRQGYKVAYEPDAYAMETGSISTGEESKRKIRIAAGGFQASWRMRALLNPFKYGVFSFQLFSHRVMRWTLSPLALALLIPSNIYLAIMQGGIYSVFLLIQVLGYAWAFLGYTMENNKKLPGTGIAWYFVMMHLSVFKGFLRYIKGKQSVAWERAGRAVNMARSI